MLTDNTFKMVEEYRKTDSLAEIQTIIQQLVKTRMPVVAWQKINQERRIVHKVMLEHPNPYEPELKLNAVSLDESICDYQKDKSIFLHTALNKMVAEVKIAYIGKENIFVLPPENIYIWDKKRVPRIKVDEESRSVIFSKQDRVFECPIIDISNTGMAFRIKKNPAVLFSYENDEIEISQISRQSLREGIKANVVYLKELDTSKTEYRVGIKFKDEIDIGESLVNFL